MSFLIPIAGSIISGIIANNAAKAQQASAQQGAADLATQTFNQQVAYVQQQEQAQRDAIAKIAAQGNPAMQAQGFLRPPNPNQYGLPPASGQLYRGGSGTPAQQAPQLQPTPMPQAPPQAPQGAMSQVGAGVNTLLGADPFAQQMTGDPTGTRGNNAQGAYVIGSDGRPHNFTADGWVSPGDQAASLFVQQNHGASIGDVLSRTSPGFTGTPAAQGQVAHQGALGGGMPQGALAPQPRFNPLRPPTPRYVQ